MPDLYVAALSATDSLGLSDTFVDAITTMKADYLIYVAAIVPIGLAIWAAPKVIGWAKRFFTGISR
ncbi:MAG: hypothetical protein J6A08_00190 [Lachnospiraceae bacterium]|nr:hypothetical protein [Lachnospiraceae bacterium]